MLKHFVVLVFAVFTACLHAGAQPGPDKIIPAPAAVISTGKTVTLNKTAKVYISSKAENKTYLQALLYNMGFKPVFTKQNAAANISVLIGSGNVKGGAEAYTLATGSKISIKANSANGAIYALQSLRQLVAVNADKISLQALTITDEPHFGWRAFMLDESRHFHGKAVVKRLLDEMAALKMNTFHWHLVDDQAWRLAIEKYPRLTSVSSKGDHTHSRQGITPAKWDSLYNYKPGKYYTHNDIKEIVRYAAQRGITIIPEIEVPGHASAAIYAYPQYGASSKKTGKGIQGDLYDVTDPATEQFLHDILDEVISLFPGKIIHIGGDEADYTHWKNSAEINAFMKQHDIPTYADLQVWAINRMSRYISSKGYRMIGWNEITGDNVRQEKHVEAGQKEQLAAGTLVQFWDGDVSLINKAIAKGYDVVNSNRFFTYLDYPYDVTPLEKAYSFNPVPEGIAAADRKKILGLGCQMWAESTPNTDRLYFQIFPRIAAYAECGWVDPAKKTPYDIFLNRFTELEKRWKAEGFIKDQLSKYR